MQKKISPGKLHLENKFIRLLLDYAKYINLMLAVGIYNVGCCYQNGIGVEMDEGIHLLPKICRDGLANGLFIIAVIRVEKDEHKAFIYYQRSAEMGLVEGTFNVGNCYLKWNWS
ncbi:hypothetical protein C2G38_2247156 [Gigaspora rosea]|uniref:Uncharacterized protein n=1 Tax=Gigaspora rosea TaxID=44941 RepID=A0A397V4D8_9GLOM|nr:hypothetical protein C2G38_2247156 [Gigaspora rosea]